MGKHQGRSNLNDIGVDGSNKIRRSGLNSWGSEQGLVRSVMNAVMNARLT